MISLDGSGLTVAQVVAVADGEPVELSGRARDAVEASSRYAVEVSAQRPLYGRTTGVGANRDVAVPAPTSTPARCCAVTRRRPGRCEPGVGCGRCSPSG